MTTFPFRCEAADLIGTDTTPTQIGFGLAQRSSTNVPALRSALYHNYFPGSLSALPAAQRRDNRRLTATDRSGSAGRERSSVRVDRIVSKMIILRPILSTSFEAFLDAYP